jgi:hypothetical protein
VWDLGAQTLPAEILIDPKATYLRTSNDSATDPVPINLADYGILAGNLVRLTSLGYFNNGVGNLSFGMMGVFSSNSVLLAQSQTHRVPGAIPAGRPYTTANTYYGSLTTDIPQDFTILRTDISVYVPAGAAYLFVSAHDSFYQDNTHLATNQFRVHVARATDTILKARNIAAGEVEITWNTDSNQWYQLESAPALPGAWTDFGSRVLGRGGRRRHYKFDGDEGAFAVSGKANPLS